MCLERSTKKDDLEKLWACDACDLWNCVGGGCIVADVERVDISELVSSEQGWIEEGGQFTCFFILTTPNYISLS